MTSLYMGYTYNESPYSQRYRKLMQDARKALVDLMGEEYTVRFIESRMQFRSPCYYWAELEAEYGRCKEGL